MRKILLLTAAVAFALGTFLSSCAAQAKNVSRSATVGPYQVTLKVLPAESFTGKNEEMVWDGGAKPVLLNSKSHPNHHLVVFVKKDGNPVEDAAIRIHYRMSGNASAQWQTLSVVRMYVKGKGRATMHYGNNVHLAPGNYVAKVTLANEPAHLFHFHIGGN